MQKVSSNIDELVEHLNKKFKGMFKSRELYEAGKKAGRAMGESTLRQYESGGASGYDYEQTGSLYLLVKGESKSNDIYQSPSSMMIGVFDPQIMTNSTFVGSMREQQSQTHWVYNSRYLTIRLKRERQLPKWIIAEFGTGSRADKKIPKDFMVNYTKRPNKEYLFGPSTRKKPLKNYGQSRTIMGNYTTDSEGQKRGYFMVSGAQFDKLDGGAGRLKRRHKGIRAGRIFRRGLEYSQEEVREIMASGIKKYLSS